MFGKLELLALNILIVRWTSDDSDNELLSKLFIQAIMSDIVIVTEITQMKVTLHWYGVKAPYN